MSILNKKTEETSKKVKNIFRNPVFETLINRAVFINQEIIVEQRDINLPDNITEVIKFLFGEGSYVEAGLSSSGHPVLIIRDASYVLKNVKTLDADLILKKITY